MEPNLVAMAVTYQELIDQYNSEISAAEQANQPATVCEKLLSLSDTYIELGFKAIKNLAHADAYTYFNEAYKHTAGFDSYYQLLDAAMAPGDLLEHNQNNHHLSEAFANFSLGQHDNSSRNPGSAAQFFGRAKQSFENLFAVGNRTLWSIFAKYSSYYKLFCEGLEDFYRAGFGNAKNKLQRAMIGLGSLIEKELPQLKDDPEYAADSALYDDTVSRFKSDYQTFRSYYYLSEAKLQFNSRNFDTAAKVFATVAKEFDLAIKNYGYAIPEPVRNISQGEYFHYLGWQQLAEAERNREEEQWDEAERLYAEVRTTWEQASTHYVLSDTPNGTMLQEYLSNTMLSIDGYQRVCENERSLKEKIAELEREIATLNSTLRDAIKPMGVTVNNSQEVVTTVKQNVEVIQKIEENAREALTEILEALKTVPLEPVSKQNLEQKAKEVLATPEKGPKFLDKVKGFTKDLSEIIKNVGEIAKPLVPAYKFLALLL